MKTDRVGLIGSSGYFLYFVLGLRICIVSKTAATRRDFQQTNLSCSPRVAEKPSLTQPSREVRTVLHPSHGLGTSQGWVITSQGLSHESLTLPILIAPSHCPIPACRGEHDSHWPKGTSATRTQLLAAPYHSRTNTIFSPSTQ